MVYLHSIMGVDPYKRVEDPIIVELAAAVVSYWKGPHIITLKKKFLTNLKALTNDCFAQ